MSPVADITAATLAATMAKVDRCVSMLADPTNRKRSKVETHLRAGYAQFQARMMNLCGWQPGSPTNTQRLVEHFEAGFAAAGIPIPKTAWDNRHARDGRIMSRDEYLANTH